MCGVRVCPHGSTGRFSSGKTCERTHALLIIVAWAPNTDYRVTTDAGLVWSVDNANGFIKF